MSLWENKKLDLPVNLQFQHLQSSLVYCVVVFIGLCFPTKASVAINFLFEVILPYKLQAHHLINVDADGWELSILLIVLTK